MNTALRHLCASVFILMAEKRLNVPAAAHDVKNKHRLFFEDAIENHKVPQGEAPQVRAQVITAAPEIG